MKSTHYPSKSFRVPASTVWSGALIVAFILGSLPCVNAQKTWIGANKLGGSGDWIMENFSPQGLPSNSSSGTANQLFFDNAAGTQDVEATVTIRSGVAAQARQFIVRNNKRVTIQMENTSSLTVSNQLLGVGGASTVAGDMSLTFSGPTTGSASISTIRFYLADDNINVGTSYSKSLTLSGNLNVTLSSTFTDIAGRASLTILDGVNLNTSSAGTASQFYIRYGSKNGRIYDNRISILGGSVTATTFNVGSIAGNIASGYALMQLGTGAQISRTAGATDPLTVNVNNGGRFEVAGAGLSSEATISVKAVGTLAIGVTSQATGTRTEAASFTLNSTAAFTAGSFLEFNIFGADEADQIIVSSTGSMTGNTKLTLITNGFIPTTADAYSLISDQNADGVALIFDLSGVDASVWDLSAFNASGDWTIRGVAAVPEPSTVALLSGALILIMLSRIRKQSAH